MLDRWSTDAGALARPTSSPSRAGTTTGATTGSTTGRSSSSHASTGSACSASTCRARSCRRRAWRASTRSPPEQRAPPAGAHRHRRRPSIGGSSAPSSAPTRCTAAALREMFEGMFRAQCTWDGAMAHNAIQALRSARGERAIMVVLIGAGHVAYGLGAERQARLWFDGRIASIIPVPIEDARRRTAGRPRRAPPTPTSSGGCRRSTDPLYPGARSLGAGARPGPAADGDPGRGGVGRRRRRLRRRRPAGRDGRHADRGSRRRSTG